MLKRIMPSSIVIIIVILMLSACGSPKQELPADNTAGNSPVTEKPSSNAGSGNVPNKPEGDKNEQTGSNKPDGQQTPEDIATVAHAESVTVLVNKHNKLPEDYTPANLVYPDVKFTFNERIDKRKMVKEATDALEQLFQAASKDGLPLAGVSAYRSHSRQKQLFEGYVQKDGLEKARTYSAFPGTSEHETGLAIDVAGADGKCSASDCFADTAEAGWLADHAHEYGFIIRYPKDKDDITGYKYEPWHLRYVGLDAASDMHESGLTFEEYTDSVKAAVHK
ncbi:M15 family metallopeptidase [Paenibacillus radicis (ex Gao et al. 2016)]|uniref:Carboxypeptidase YodJ n=1 Tax=Paenibacillus radicis (ex Gao et al. 2016) TaxID=1737354 RepID=A0A917HHY7_9BACL|nr:M15 family metallopeptidase [Paenibacillus radicis (ex Gao et al. 2016)]GGG79468.1 putative carboxypeptidase YodJ [Paenibacillus radicis (ex Gao et al. 2016)]